MGYELKIRTIVLVFFIILQKTNTRKGVCRYSFVWVLRELDRNVQRLRQTPILTAKWQCVEVLISTDDNPTEPGGNCCNKQINISQSLTLTHSDRPELRCLTPIGLHDGNPLKLRLNTLLVNAQSSRCSCFEVTTPDLIIDCLTQTKCVLSI